MPRFVILEHDYPHLHWDFMLEANEALHTWRLNLPPENAKGTCEAVAIPDHRKIYLDYEGPVSGDRGTVRRWDAGDYTEQIESSPEARRMILHGTRVEGFFQLDHVQGEVWRLRWNREETIKGPTEAPAI